MLKAEDKSFIQECVDNDGIDYVFREELSLDDIEDEEFQRLKTAYLEATQALIHYCGIEE